MQILIIIAIAVHAVSAVFWMGTTANQAQMGAAAAEILFPRQMGAAIVSVLTGGFLWSQLHAGGFGTYEMILAAGAACAVLALVILVAGVGTRLRGLKAGGDQAAIRKAMAVTYRITAALLGVALICMVIARFV
jgi:hypothetical protein